MFLPLWWLFALAVAEVVAVVVVIDVRLSCCIAAAAVVHACAGYSWTASRKIRHITGAGPPRQRSQNRTRALWPE